MVRILFVCHGNICRSTMAEFLFRDLAERRGYGDRFHIESAATSREEIGNPVHHGTRRVLERLGIDCSGKRARQMTREDYDRFDLLIGMDHANIRNMNRIAGGDPEGKISLMLDHGGRPGQEVADPWYTGDFETTYRDIMAGCEGLLSELTEQTEEHD